MQPQAKLSNHPMQSVWLCVFVCLLVMQVFSQAHAYQRSYLNLGFEQPVIDSRAPCRVYLANTRVPGWLTTHPFWAEAASSECSTSHIATTGTGQIIEIWQGPRDIAGGSNTTNRMPAREGNQFVELNAEAVSELQQNICLVNGEPVSWRFSHNGRNTTNDTMVFRAGTQPIVNVSTSTTGSGAVTNCYAGTCTVNSSMMTQDGVTRWADYSGTFNYTGASGQTVIGFQSTSGSSTSGNFLDGVQITVKPIVEFTSANYSTPENNGSPQPVQVVVAGIVPTGGLTLTFNVTGGTAVLGGDYTINGGSASTFNVTLPAGDYGQGTPLIINVPVSIVDDAVSEPDETFSVSLQPNSNYHLMSTSVCGASGNGSATYTIIDNDAPTDMDLRIVKSQRAGNSGTFQTTPLTVPGGTFQYRLVVSNQGVTTLTSGTPAAFSDAVPANFTGMSVISANTGAGATSCSASFTGNTLNGLFSGPPGATCTVTVEGTAATSGTINNTATVTVPAGNNEIYPMDNTSTVTTTIARARLNLYKISNGDTGTFTFTLTNTTQNSGNTVTTSFPGVPEQVDGVSATAGTQAFIISTSGAITIQESSIPAGWTLNGATCTNNSSGATVGTFTNPTYTIPNASNTAGQVFDCYFLNNKNPTIKVEKTSYGGTAGFTFADTNLTGAVGTLTTTSSGTPVQSANLPVTVAGTNVTITETPTAGYTLTSASCVDDNSAFTGNLGTFGSLTGSVLTVPSSNFVLGADIRCTFSNRRSTTLTLRKTWAAGSTAGHTATVASSGFINTATSGTSTATAAGNTTTGTATTVYVGESGTIGELFGGGAQAADYAATLSCTGTNGTLSGNTLTVTSATGTAIVCTETNTKLPKITLTKISNGGVGGFSFTGNNGFANQTITTVTPGVSVAGTTQTLSAASVATVITETIPAGYVVSSIACSGLGAGGTATTNLNTGTVSLDAAATAPGAAIACTFTNAKIPTVKVQKITNNGFGGPFSFAQTNLSGAPAAITTTATNTATPASPTAIEVTAIGTAITLTETPATNFALSSASCTDANSAVTGNTGALCNLRAAYHAFAGSHCIHDPNFNSCEEDALIQYGSALILNGQTIHGGGL